MIAAKTVRQSSGVAAAACVARGEADLAMTFIPELLQAAGVRILGPLPPPFGHATGYAAAVFAGSPNRESARAFVHALTAPGSRDVWVKAGFAVG
jgi:ABC-type molybdate transport system substrate-binding protein